MTAAKAKKKPPAPVPAEHLADTIFRVALEAILDEIRGIKSGAIKPKEHDPTSRIAWLAQKAAAVGAEQRKAEAAEIKRIGSLRIEDVLAYIRQLTRDQRARLLREAATFDAEGTVLA